jgi:hypothetical protein
VPASALAPADGKSHDPQDEKYDRSDPQEMYGESGPKEDQYKQQGENHEVGMRTELTCSSYGRCVSVIPEQRVA